MFVGAVPLSSIIVGRHYETAMKFERLLSRVDRHLRFHGFTRDPDEAYAPSRSSDSARWARGAEAYSLSYDRKRREVRLRREQPDRSERSRLLTVTALPRLGEGTAASDVLDSLNDALAPFAQDLPLFPLVIHEDDGDEELARDQLELETSLEYFDSDDDTSVWVEDRLGRRVRVEVYQLSISRCELA